MKSKNYFFLFLLILLILLNFYLFPKFNFYVNYSTYLSIVIGALGAVLAVNVLKDTQAAKNKSLIALFLPIIVFIGLAVFNVFYSVEVENDVLNTNGIQTTAEIINKKHLKFKRAETFEFTIRFRNQESNIIETKLSTLLNEYENHKIGDQINIKYSSENNDLVQLVE